MSISEESVRGRLSELHAEYAQLRERATRVQIAIEELSKLLGTDAEPIPISASVGAVAPSPQPSTPLAEVVLSPKSNTPVLTNVGALKRAIGR